MKKKILSIIVAIMIAVTGAVVGLPMLTDEAHAATNHTKDEAIAWMNSQIGRQLNPDGVYPGQCVDLVLAYYDYMVGGHAGISGNAKDYAWNRVPSGFTRIQGASPQPGDIVISTVGTWGHVWLQGYNGQTYHSNNPYGDLHVRRYNNTNFNGAIWGVIRPDFLPPPPPPTPKGAPIGGGNQTVSDGDYHIVSALDNNMGIDVYGGNSADGTNVQIFTNTTDANQVFTLKYTGDGFYTIIHKKTKKSLDVRGAKLEYGTNLQTYQPNSTAAQRWVLEPSGDGRYFYIKAQCNGLCVDVCNADAKNYTNIQMYGSNGSNAQKWRFISTEGSKTVANGDYHIVSALDNSMGLDASVEKNADGANARLFKNTKDKDQVFTVSFKNGFYTIRNKKTKKVLDMSGNNTVSGTNVWLYKNNGTDAQKWIIRKSGKGYYNIIAKGSGLCVDVTGGKVKNNQNIQGYVNNGTAAQKWKFVPVKKSNPLKLKGKTATVKYSKLKKKTQTLKVSKVVKFTKKGKGKITYKLISAKKGKKSFKKKFKINSKTGKVKVKKGLKKGTYKVKIKVKAAGNAKYKKDSKTVTFKVRVR